MVDNRLWIWGRTHFSRTWMVQCREIFKIIRSPKNLNGGIWWLCSVCSCKPSIRHSIGQSPHSQASVSGPRTWFRAFGRHESGPWQGQSSLLPPGSWYLRRVRHWSSQLQKRAYRTDLHFLSWSCLGILAAKAWESLTKYPCIEWWILYPLYRVITERNSWKLPISKRSVHLPHGVRDAVSLSNLATTVGGRAARYEVELYIYKWSALDIRH